MSKAVAAQNWAGRLFTWNDGTKRSNQQLFTNPIGANVAAGGDSTFYFENMPIGQDATLFAKALSFASAPGTNSGTPATVDSSGWPTQDFAISIHASTGTASWPSFGGLAFACGYISRGAGTEVITATGTASIQNIDRTAAPLVKFDLLVPSGSTAFGYTVTSTAGGGTGIFNYLPKYRANAVNGHVDITSANVALGTPIFTAEAIALYKLFRMLRVSCWAQNVWRGAVGHNIAFASNPAIGAKNGTLVANSMPAGTYTAIFAPTPFQSIPDIRTYTTTVTGQTAIDWTTGGGALTFAATSAMLPATSATRRTPQNVKCAPTPAWNNEEGYPLGTWLAFSKACGNGIWMGLPVWDDGTYFPAALQELHDERVVGQIYNIELANELWNGSLAQQCFDALRTQAGFPTSITGKAQYWATRAHAIANQGRTLFGSDWNNTIRLVCAWQNGAFNFIAAVCSYMVSQGWSPSADLWCGSFAPYFIGAPAIVAGDTIAQIQAKVTTGTTFPYVQNHTGGQMHVESGVAVCLYYKLPGVFECYECNWDTVSEWNAVNNANIGLAALDSGIRPIMAAAYHSLEDIGVKALMNFEVGVSSDATAESPRYEITNDYDNFATAPRLLGMQDVMDGIWTPSRNVVAAVGTTQIDARNYPDSTPTINTALPNHGTTLSPVANTGGIGWVIQVPVACVKTFKVYHTTSTTASFNATLDGTQVATAVAIASGLSNSPVTYGSLTLSAGHHYIEIGSGALAAGVTDNMLEFS